MGGFSLVHGDLVAGLLDHPEDNTPAGLDKHPLGAHILVVQGPRAEAILREPELLEIHDGIGEGDNSIPIPSHVVDSDICVADQLGQLVHDPQLSHLVDIEDLVIAQLECADVLADECFTVVVEVVDYAVVVRAVLVP